GDGWLGVRFEPYDGRTRCSRQFSLPVPHRVTTANGTATTTRRHRLTARQWHSHASLWLLDWRWKEVASGEGRRRQRGGCLRIQPDAVRPAFSLPCSGTGASVTSAPYPFGLKGHVAAMH